MHYDLEDWARFEKADQKEIKRKLNALYGKSSIYGTCFPLIGGGKPIEMLFPEKAQLESEKLQSNIALQKAMDKFNKNRRNYHGDHMDSLSYVKLCMQVPNEIKINRYENWKWSSTKEAIINHFKEDEKMRKAKQKVKQCVIVFDNGENFLMDIEEATRGGFYINDGRPPITIIGREASYSMNSENDKYLTSILDSWRSSLQPDLKPKKVIFNDPATIVIWADNSETMVKCQKNEVFDREKGLALCFMKKAMGNKGKFNDAIKKAISDHDATMYNKELKRIKKLLAECISSYKERIIEDNNLDDSKYEDDRWIIEFTHIHTKKNKKTQITLTDRLSKTSYTTKIYDSDLKKFTSEKIKNFAAHIIKALKDAPVDETT